MCPYINVSNASKISTQLLHIDSESFSFSITETTISGSSVSEQPENRAALRRRLTGPTGAEKEQRVHRVRAQRAAATKSNLTGIKPPGRRARTAAALWSISLLSVSLLPPSPCSPVSCRVCARPEATTFTTNKHSATCCIGETGSKISGFLMKTFCINF